MELDSLDGTFGGGGHTLAILAASAPDGRVLALDADPSAIARGDSLAASPETGGRLRVVHANFADLAEVAHTTWVARRPVRFLPDQVDGRVLFELGGRHNKLFEDITPADVRWICQRLSKLTDRQWRDAFNAGGFPPSDAERFIRRMKQKIAEGLALQG